MEDRQDIKLRSEAVTEVEQNNRKTCNLFVKYSKNNMTHGGGKVFISIHFQIQKYQSSSNNVLMPLLMLYCQYCHISASWFNYSCCLVFDMYIVVVMTINLPGTVLYCFVL